MLEEKRAAGRVVLDLTGTHPGEAGLQPDAAAILSALADPRALDHAPAPRGTLRAREAVARYLSERAERAERGERAGAAVDPDSVFLTASTSEAYANLFRLLCEPGDEVLVPRPSYPLLEPIARLEDVGTHAYRLVYDGAWRLDPDSLEASLTPRTRAIVLVEPNNPTGSVLSLQEFTLVERICRERGLVLIADEVFGDFPWAPRESPFAGRLGGRSVPTFVLGGISKSCGLPQLKLGWIAVDGPAPRLMELIPSLEWILDLFLSVSGPVQWALPDLLATRHAYQAHVRRRLDENLAVIAAAERRHVGSILPYPGEGGWSAVLRIRPEGSGPDPGEEMAEWALRDRDVHVHPAHFYELDRDDLVVLSLITPPDVLREALERLVAP